MVGDDDRQQKRTRGGLKEVGTGSTEKGDRVRQGKEAAFWTLQNCFPVPSKAQLYKKLSSAFRLGFFPFSVKFYI
ncbi:hypothetical protein D5086_014226 [Populus alba]|uniref:Uncharacterized protein n=1 Tax=Populus alba TaxID=43335 RepID=A0ACC4BXK2_POPAL